MFYLTQYIKNVGSLSKIGVHTSSCCLKSGLKNNWMKKLNRVNRPSESNRKDVYNQSSNENKAVINGETVKIYCSISQPRFNISKNASVMRCSI